MPLLWERNSGPEEFEEAAVPHLQELYRTAAAMIGDRSEAQDIVQEVYLEAWKSFHRFQPGTNCRAWLFRILFHRLQHYRRKWLRIRPVSDTEASVEETLAFEPPVPEQVTDEEVLRALEKVPSDFRAVLLLADVHEFSYKEIAGTLKIPVGTVMSRLSRARKLLRSELGAFAQSRGIGNAKGGRAL